MIQNQQRLAKCQQEDGDLLEDGFKKMAITLCLPHGQRLGSGLHKRAMRGNGCRKQNPHSTGKPI